VRLLREVERFATFEPRSFSRCGSVLFSPLPHAGGARGVIALGDLLH
jgi:hypothetical protein